MAVDIVAVDTENDLQSVKQLFQAYVQWLDIDLSFQDFKSELDSLPGRYASPAGALLLAKNSDGKAVGCVALRPLVPHKTCEIKRLYVLPDARGTRAGHMLARTIINTAVNIGYEKIRLDTLPHMTSAISLYKQLGFHEVGAYYSTPLEETIFFELDLKSQSDSPSTSERTVS